MIHRRVVSSVAVLASGFALVVACNPSNNSSSPSDAGMGSETTNLDGAFGGGEGGGGGGGDLCSILTDYDTRCGHTSACDQAHHDACPQTVLLMSDALRNAAIACTPTAACGDGGPKGDKPLDNGCTEALLVATPTTAAQNTLRDDYCGHCPQVADCANTFYALSSDGGSSGFGAIVLFANDTLVAQIQDECIDKPLMTDGGASKVCGFGFPFCSAAVLNAASPTPAACSDM